jgi:hypothetical protein
VSLALPKARAFGETGSDAAATESGPLSVSGRRVLTADGTPWFGVGVSWFTGLQDWIENQAKAERFIEWTTAHGLQWMRVFGQYNGGIGRFIPAEHPSYYADLRGLAERLATAGLRMEFVVNADCQNAPLTFDVPHFDRCDDALDGSWNVLLSGGNEAPFNGFDPRQLHQPKRLLAARCSMGTDARPFEPSWDFAIYEGERDDQFYRKYKSVFDLYQDGFSVPILVDEMVGIGDVHEPGRTTNDPWACWQFAAGLKLMGAMGVCAHLRSGITGDIPVAGGPAEHCIDAMVAAGRLPLGAYAFGHYERGNSPSEDQNPSLPVIHHDLEAWQEIGYRGDPTGALRTHAMIEGNRAEVIAPTSSERYQAIAAHNWRIVQAYGYPGKPANVFVCER